MISYELFDGEVSLIKYLNQLTMEVGTNSYLVKGKANLHLNEKSFIYKVLSYVSTSLCFKDWTSNYHLQSQAGSRRECHTEYSTTKKTVQNRQCGKVDEQICSRVPQEQCKDVSTRKCSTSYEKECSTTYE